MLKDLLQTLIESVFTSKKSYISAQAFPGATYRTNLGLVASGSFIAPSDGYFGFYVNGGDVVDVYAHNQAQAIVTRVFLRVSSPTVMSCSYTIPVPKGCTVTYTFGAAPTELWFSPSGGSE